jgi:hypothetical protein
MMIFRQRGDGVIAEQNGLEKKSIHAEVSISLPLETWIRVKL